MRRPESVLVLGSLLAVLALGCARQADEDIAGAGETPADTAAAVTATVTLAPTEGNQASGTVQLTQEPGGVRLVADLSGLTPGEHGFHVHEVGDCSAPDASSAGDHFNPTGATHGAPGTGTHHLGDLGNVTADASGNARLDRVFPGLTLEGDQSIVGRALVVHASEDDLASQPSGESGARVACGVIARQ
jgi:superoxide dismutase, Cu-Zn family